ncbi:toll-like receptor 13 [Carassius gibelio]|uniref:toll-like receptor 13 n=1 Tax=Carassius gibelio TaxID=101364 RepID=UPI002277EC36|nr:toll-like receptor 13 [Carassius gibelio]XP_052462047.1 toll-like receptor 13 [Carassius gibelio]XP_052462055.1 toll-like receptor 13 [Carassius gibelio]
MVSLFSLYILLLKTSCICSWLADKCLFYSDVKEFPVETTCAGKTNIAECHHVTNIKEDLRGLPSNLLNLCIQMEPDFHGALAPDSFSRFASLEYLEIVGCFSEIPPEAFNELTNVSSLTLSFLSTEICCEVALDFSRLSSLNHLSLSQYSLSPLAPNVFETIPLLQKLKILNVCLKNISEVVCRLAKAKSLKLFKLEEYELNRLHYPNCSVFNISDSYISTEFDIEEVHFYLGIVEHVDQGALKALGNIYRLCFVSNTDFLRDLSLFGVHKIHDLSVRVDVLNVDDLCTAAKSYSVESLEVRYETINMPLTPANISHGCDDIKGIVLKGNIYVYKIVDLLDVYSVFQIFRNLTLVNIIKHVLRPNDFFSLCASFPQTVKSLSVMILSTNNIDKIISNQFYCFAVLEMLDLSVSNISNIEDFAFIGLPKLKELKLCSNKLSYIYRHAFSGLYGLMVLDLQENPLIHIEPASFGDLINLSALLLGDLNFPPAVTLITLHFSDIFGIIPYNLSYVLISSGLRPMQLVVRNHATLGQGLTFHIKSEYVTVEGCNSSLLTYVDTLKINAAYMNCGNEFIGKYVRSVVNLEFRSVFSDGIGDLAVINQLVHLKTLKLENIDLTKQPNLATMFHNLTKLQTLILTNCRMFFLDGSLTKDLKALTGLVLIPKDNINVLQNLVEHLTSLKYLHLLGLGLYCNCDNAWLVSWAKDNRKVQVAMFKPTMKELQCLTDNGIDHLNFVDYSKTCLFDIEFVFFTSTSGFLCIFIIVVLSYKFAGQYIAPFYHIASGWLREALHVNSKHQYRYDVFVSYSSKDENWVMEELLPNLEQRGPPFLRLCLHSRDFQLGQDIVENITDSIYASRRTLCLISRNYIRSNWCSLEMQLATYRLQVEHRDILILVFLEMIPSRLLSSHHRLARLVKTRTYLDWPREPEMHEAFWDRLWCKLSSDKTN